jgi:NIMA (never in mitosis gene a)-related kinase
MATLKHAFEAGNMKGLVLKILRGKYPKIASFYSVKLRELIDKCLRREPRDRPSVNSILKMGFVKARIANFLSETMYADEFSHTVLHSKPLAPSPMVRRSASSSSTSSSATSASVSSRGGGAAAAAARKKKATINPLTGLRNEAIGGVGNGVPSRRKASGGSTGSVGSSAGGTAASRKFSAPAAKYGLPQPRSAQQSGLSAQRQRIINRAEKERLGRQRKREADAAAMQKREADRIKARDDERKQRDVRRRGMLLAGEPSSYLLYFFPCCGVHCAPGASVHGHCVCGGSCRSRTLLDGAVTRHRLVATCDFAAVHHFVAMTLTFSSEIRAGQTNYWSGGYVGRAEAAGGGG